MSVRRAPSAAVVQTPRPPGGNRLAQVLAAGLTRSSATQGVVPNLSALAPHPSASSFKNTFKNTFRPAATGNAASVLSKGTAMGNPLQQAPMFWATLNMAPATNPTKDEVLKWLNNFRKAWFRASVGFARDDALRVIDLAIAEVEATPEAQITVDTVYKYGSFFASVMPNWLAYAYEEYRAQNPEIVPPEPQKPKEKEDEEDDDMEKYYKLNA